MLRSPWFLSITAIALSASHVISQHLQTTVIRKYPFSEKCNHQDRLAIIKCEDDARNTWNVDDSTYYTSSRKFCCFVWETLACSVDVAQRCDTNYAAELSIVTEETLHSLCDYSSGSSSCTFPAWSWWPLVPIVLGCIAICGIVLFFAYPSNELVRSRTKTVLSQYDEEMAESAI